nr:hypothetical protein [Betaproteobacteria bacterium]
SVVPYPPGRPLDQIARALAERMRESLNQPLIVENRAGAGGNIGADHVAKSQGDGYTLLIGAVATHAINPFLYARMPYDANRDFVPVGLIAVVPNVLVMTEETAQRLRVSSLGDVVAYARKYPGKLNYASGGNGSAGHLAAELFKSVAGLSMVHIPYAGAAPAQLGLLSGQTDLMFDNLASAAGQIQAGWIGHNQLNRLGRPRRRGLRRCRYLCTRRLKARGQCKHKQQSLAHELAPIEHESTESRFKTYHYITLQKCAASDRQPSAFNHTMTQVKDFTDPRTWSEAGVQHAL